MFYVNKLLVNEKMNIKLPVLLLCYTLSSFLKNKEAKSIVKSNKSIHILYISYLLTYVRRAYQRGGWGGGGGGGAEGAICLGPPV